VPLYVSARGLTTNAMPIDDRAFEIAFDFVDHRLTAVDTRGTSFAIDLRPMSVSSFYRTLMDGLTGMDIVVPDPADPQRSDGRDPLCGRRGPRLLRTATMWPRSSRG